MQASVKEILTLGPLPHSAAAEVERIASYETLMKNVEQPVSDDDARALAGLLGPDDCFGLAWALVHLIETAPGWPLSDVLEGRSGAWIAILNDRSLTSRS
ncbi:hypothetical protein ACQR1I_02765 [Bradyrhizobium sp. HKCCYLS2038]